MSTLQSVLVRVAVTPSTYAALEKLSILYGDEIENVAAHVLEKFSDIDVSSISAKPIVLTDAIKREIDKLLARNITSADDLVARLSVALSVRIDDVNVALTPYLLQRLHTRCIGMDFEPFLRARIVRLLEEFAGVR